MGIVYNEILEECENNKLQKRIDELAQKYKNKNIVLYGAGIFLDVIFQNYNLSALNIVAVSDIKFQEKTNCQNLPGIHPSQINQYSPSIVLITAQKTAIIEDFFQDQLFEEIGEFKYGIFFTPQLEPGYNYAKEIYQDYQANSIIKKELLSSNPLMVCRHGGTELKCIVDYIDGKGWSDFTKKYMKIYSGFFPTTDDNLTKFAELYLDSTKEIDMLGVWFNHGENYVTKKYSPEARLFHLRNLEPFNVQEPWTEALKGKKVLVVHPFEKSIQNQYNKNRTKLFKNELILPEFDLKTIKAVQTIGNNSSDFNSWFEAYEYMCNQISDTDYDIAIIGAGSYGLVLAAHVKKMGKKAVHMGGATQLLFGIKGQRWTNDSRIPFNEYWVNPLEEERPKGSELVESNCYW
jgi:hypothetical protein